jgi:hypothetical protein
MADFLANLMRRASEAQKRGACPTRAHIRQAEAGK